MFGKKKRTIILHCDVDTVPHDKVDSVLEKRKEAFR
jgi:hypothetical protein